LKTLSKSLCRTGAAVALFAGAFLQLASFQIASAETGLKGASPYREGEVLGPDSSSEPLPVELVEDPALGGPVQFQRTKGTRRAPPPPREALPSSEPAAGSETGSLPNLTSDEDATTTLNVKDVEIATLVKSFSRIAKRNYVVDSNVKGKVTIHLAEPVNREEALRILDSVLLLKGFTTVPIGPNTYKVIQAKDAKKTTIPTGYDDQNSKSDALITQLIRLKNVPAADLQQTLQQFVSGDGLLTNFSGTNSLILIDSAANIERVMKLVKQLDVPALDQDVTVIPIKYAEAKDIAEKVNQILGQGDEKGGSSSGPATASVNPAVRIPPVTPPPNNAGAGLPNAAGTGGGDGKRSLPAKVIADERTNSVIVVADPDTTGKVQALVERLDSKVDLSGGRFYVMRLKHADAEELSDVLNQLLGGGGGGSGRSSQTSGSSLSRRSRNDDGGYGRGFGGTSSGGGRGRFGGGGLGGGGSGGSDSGTRSGGSTGFTVTPGQQGQGAAKVNFEGEVSIASDPSTNSLIVNASRNDYMKVKEVVDMLDVKRKQVLVEGTILEVSVDETEALGIELIGSLATDKAGVIAQTNYGGITDLLSNPAGLRDLTIAAASSGSITLPGGVTIPTQAMIIKAVSKNQNVNVLSNPTILTTDNQEAEIVVGQNIPIVTSRGTNSVNLQNSFNNIDRQDVGITLRLTPQIGGGDFVTMKVFVEISDVVTGTEGNQNGPTTTVRTSETNVEVKSGQMVVTGGLIQDNVSNSDQGIPFWKDIPIFGNFFKQSSDRRRRTNLLIFITPRIVSDQFDARDVTLTKRDSLETAIPPEDGTDRSPQLRNDDIDRVFEVNNESGSKPSMITPPKHLTAEEAEAVRATAARLAKVSPSRTKDVFSVTVKPKLPGDASQPEVPQSDVIVPPAKKTVPEPQAKAENESFVVVLRQLGNDGQVLGLEVPGTIDGPAGKFFQTGSRVKHRSDGAEFVTLSRYKNRADAKKAPLPVDKWQALTPSTVVSLGTGEWVR